MNVSVTFRHLHLSLHLHLDERDGSRHGACYQQHGKVRQPISSRKETETLLLLYMCVSYDRDSESPTIELLTFSLFSFFFGRTVLYMCIKYRV